jgi:hypothetical protein
MKTLTERVVRFAPPGGVFDETVVRNLFPDVSEGARKLLVHRATAGGEILRLKPGLFILRQEYRKTDLHPFVIAAMLHAPSHISLESALAHHGLIPEAVQQVSSVTAARSRTFKTPLGVFSFQRVLARHPRAGVEAVRLGSQGWAFIATPLRALADLLYLNNAVSWSKDGMAYVLDSLRIEEDDLAGIPAAALPEICDSIRTRRVVNYLERMAKEVPLAT